MAYNYSERRVFAGHKVEEDMCIEAYRLLPVETDRMVMAGNELDWYSGIDLMYKIKPEKNWRVRIDFTVNPAKDNTEWFDSLAIEVERRTGTKVRFGIRYGNSHNGYTEFKYPVLVLFFDFGYNNTWQWSEVVAEGYAKHFEEVKAVGEKLYVAARRLWRDKERLTEERYLSL